MNELLWFMDETIKKNIQRNNRQYRLDSKMLMKVYSITYFLEWRDILYEVLLFVFSNICPAKQNNNKCTYTYTHTSNIYKNSTNRKSHVCLLIPNSTCFQNIGMKMLFLFNITNEYYWLDGILFTKCIVIFVIRNT